VEVFLFDINKEFFNRLEMIAANDKYIVLINYYKEWISINSKIGNLKRIQGNMYCISYQG